MRVPGDKKGASAFILAFFAMAACGLLAIFGLHIVLAAKHVLPAPPITATNCINDKFAFLRRAPLEEAKVVAFGSSVTWRNLDMKLLSEELRAQAINAAPCYLHVDQSAYLADFLAERAPNLEILLVAFHPRDFEDCDPNETAFFNRRLAAGYVDGWLPIWVPYVTGFQPRYLLREARRIAREGWTYGLEVVEDQFGSSILRKPGAWRPDIRIDPRCFAFLPALEETAAEHGARLVVATVPTMPSWKKTHDPNGTILTQWRQSIDARLTRPDTIFIDGSGLRLANEDFSDPAHLLYPAHSTFTAFIAEKMKAHAGAPGL